MAKAVLDYVNSLANPSQLINIAVRRETNNAQSFVVFHAVDPSLTPSFSNRPTLNVQIGRVKLPWSEAEEQVGYSAAPMLVGGTLFSIVEGLGWHGTPDQAGNNTLAPVTFLFHWSEKPVVSYHI